MQNSGFLSYDKCIKEVSGNICCSVNIFIERSGEGNEKKKSIFGSVVFLMCVLLGAVPVSAKTTVSKVTCTRVDKNGRQYFVMYGKTSTGKKVWKYTSKTYTSTELNALSYKTVGNKVYIIEGRMLPVLNKQTGKALLKKNPFFAKNKSGMVMYVDSAGNLYTTGYYERVIYKISPKGKVLWKKTVRSDCYWPYKMKISGNKLVVYYEGEGTHAAILYNQTGKTYQYIK